MQLDVPEELAQDVAQKDALLEQSKSELQQATTGLATFEATLAASQAAAKQAQADVRRFESEHRFQQLQFQRIESLARDRTVTTKRSMRHAIE